MYGTRLPLDRHASALLVSLAVLAVLSILGAAFVLLTRTESLAGSVHVEGTRARCLAIAGLEYAVARLAADAGARTASDPGAPWRYGGGPLETTDGPSYRAGSAQGRAFSGALGGTYVAGGDQFVLKILDTGSQIHLGSPVPALPSMLDTLGRAIRDERSAAGLEPIDPIAGRGAAIVALRESLGGFVTKEPLAALLGERDYRIAEDYLSISSWVDPHTVASSPGAFPEGMPAFETEPRAPVNVNTAPRPVLVAVLAGLAGPAGGRLPYLCARELSDRILARRASPLPTEGPFRNWREFYEFVEGLSRPPAPVLTREWAGLVLANADPNFHPSRLNLEKVLFRPVDKTDLRYWTTEFTLRETGLYEITSLGRVIGPSAQVLAAAKVRAVVRVFGLLYHTVQADFERRRSSPPSENATTWPNPRPSAGGVPAAWAGHVQLQTERPRDDLSGAPVLFQALLREGFAADAASGSPDPWTEQEPSPDVARGADLFPDGLFFSPDRDELTGWTATGNARAPEGALEFWVKFDRSESDLPVPLALLTFPATSEAGVQHRIRAALRAETLVVESRRLFYVSEDYGPEPLRNAFPVPYLAEETTWMSVLPGHGQTHEWHHVAVSWLDGTEQVLAVDGLSGVEISRTPTSPGVAFEGWPPYPDLLLFGGARTDERGRETASATIDDVRIHAAAGPSGVLDLSPSRFEDATLTYAGRFEGAFDPLPRTVRLLGVSWTEWIPESYDGLPLAQLPVSIEVGLDVGGGMVPVADGIVEDALALLGLGIVVQNREVRYRIDFKHDPAVTPLNVTPVLDDITIAFWPGKVEYVEFAWILSG